jgi:hypothetical protein
LRVALTGFEYFRQFSLRSEYFRALAELSQLQQQAIAASDYSSLLETLQHKQQLIDELRGRCETCLATSEQLLAQLLEAEANCTQELTVKRDRTRQELAAVSTGHLAHAAYHDREAPPLAARFDFDS